MCSIFQWVRRKVPSAVQPKGSSKMKWGIITALYFSMFGYAITVQLVFAFLPDMVKSFGIADEDAGYYVGMLASSLYLGRFLTSYFWGWLCDRIGRRKVLLWCLAFLIIATLSFGFSKSIATAFVIRLLTGLAGGIPGTVKASLTDICDESNQALGMSVIISAWNSGLIIGPAVGGYLAKPATKYPVFKKGSLFDDYAYLLPCVINAGMLLFSFLLVFFIFPETLPSPNRGENEEVLPVPNDCKETLQTAKDDSSLNRRCLSRHTQSETDLPTTSIAKQNVDVNIDVNESSGKRHNMIPSGSVSCLHDIHSHDFMYTSQALRDTPSIYVLPNDKPKPTFFAKLVGSFTRSKLLHFCRDRNVRCTVALYSVFSFGTVAEHELYSLWASSGKDLGGLSFDTNDLGFTLMVVGIGTAASSFIIFPQMVKTFGDMKTQFLMLYTTMFFTIVLPATNILYYRNTTLKVVVICILLLIRTSQGCCFAGQFIFIGNSVKSNYRASVHGLSITVMCLGRSISPTVNGSLFSWSITSGLGFPFNEKLVYIFMGFVFWLSLVVACCLDPEAVTKRKD